MFLKMGLRAHVIHKSTVFCKTLLVRFMSSVGPWLRRRFLLEAVPEKQEHHLHCGPEGGDTEPRGAGGAHPGAAHGSARGQSGEHSLLTRDKHEVYFKPDHYRSNNRLLMKTLMILRLFLDDVLDLSCSRCLVLLLHVVLKPFKMHFLFSWFSLV